MLYYQPRIVTHIKYYTTTLSDFVCLFTSYRYVSMKFYNFEVDITSHGILYIYRNVCVTLDNSDVIAIY